MRCLTTTRLNMKADLLHQTDYSPDAQNPDEAGEWVNSQHPLTGEIIRVWRPYPNDPGTPENETLEFGTIDCLARGIVDGGIRVAGTTERFGDTYENIDFVKMWIPPSVIVTKRDRVTNIRTRQGKTVWLNEEYGNDIPTLFNVNGVTPLFDAFNNHVESFVLLERAEVA